MVVVVVVVGGQKARLECGLFSVLNALGFSLLIAAIVRYSLCSSHTYIRTIGPLSFEVLSGGRKGHSEELQEDAEGQEAQRGGEEAFPGSFPAGPQAGAGA